MFFRYLVVLLGNVPFVGSGSGSLSSFVDSSNGLHVLFYSAFYHVSRRGSGVNALCYACDASSAVALRFFLSLVLSAGAYYISGGMFLSIVRSLYVGHVSYYAYSVKCGCTILAGRAICSEKFAGV